MKSVSEIDLKNISAGRSYWNSSRPVGEEMMYFLLIDRFHDGKTRDTIFSENGFGNQEELKARCGGTIRGIISNLKYIAGMGFTSIWINPFLQNNPESYHGYAIENFLEVDQAFGTKEDLIEFVSIAHQYHIKVFFDVVLNHTGNNWSYICKDPVYSHDKNYVVKSWRYRDLPLPIELRDFNRYSRKGRIINWEDAPETWDGDIFELKDLIQDDTETGLKNLELMVAVYSYWFALTDCDGFRIDTAKHIRPWWLDQFIDRIKLFTSSLGKHDFFVFAEIVGTQSLIQVYSKIDGYLDFDFHFNVVEALLDSRKIMNPVYYEPSLLAMPIRFLDNHDQIGQMPKQRIANRTQDERAFINLLRVFLLMPGVPCIYYGTEQGLRGKGINDGAIRECLFNPFGNEDLLNADSSYVKTIMLFSEFRKKWQMFTGKVHACVKEPETGNNSIALQISNLTSEKYLVYNLTATEELVCIKLSPLISRT
ncbi:MAG: alpha-amylase family glycosyl hydrolase, partial [Cytophaga sp.]|uniref:alpha-amylase family glycosyl hydrolase n=1 Tax=Cytophaga sp. TaxID=29535 RepID=UPI003F7E17B2